MFGIPAKKSRDRLDNGLLIDVPGIHRCPRNPNLIRIGKIEQIYSQLQTKTRDRPDEKMITLEKHLSILVKDEKITLLETQKWANDLKAFADCMQRT